MFVFLVLFSMLSFAETPENQLRKYYLPHFSTMKPSESHLIDLDQNRVGYLGSMLSELTEDDKPVTISEKDKREYLIGAWAQKFPESSVLQNSDLPEHLQVFSGTSKPHLYAKLFPTKTILGEVYGAYMLTSGATSDINLIKQRQDWIKTLSRTQNDTESIKHIENALFDIFHPDGTLNAYVKSGSLSPQVPVIEQDEKNWVPFVLSHTDSSWLLLANPMRLPSLVVAKYATLLAIPVEFLTLQVTLSGFCSIQSYGVGAFFNGCLWRTTSAMLGALSVLSLGMSSYDQYKTHNRLSDLNSFLTKRLKSLGVLLETLSKIGSETRIPENLRPRLDPNARDAIQTILNDIHGLADEDSYFFHGNLVRALITTERVLAYKSTLERLLLTLGALDFYGSVAHSQFVYATLLEEPTPMFEAKALRHPSISRDNSVANDVSLAHMLLTGPNASGKSTIMRAIGINTVYLAQTLGIATADSLSLTPFHVFHAFMETRDKTGESSSYQTELNRLIDALRVSKNKRGFYLADELFSSTNAVDALIGSQEILNRFSNLKQSIGIVSTHLSGLSSSKNFHMAGYRLFEGPSSEHNALAILEQALGLPPLQRGNQEKFGSRFAKHELVYQMLAPELSEERELKIDSDIWGDLELSDVIPRLLPIQTTTGEVWAKLYFSHLATPKVSDLLSRQTDIKALTQKPNLLKTLRQHLDSIHNLESSLLDAYDKFNWVNARVIKELYPQDEDVNLKLMEKMLSGTMAAEQRQVILENQQKIARFENRNMPAIAMRQFMQLYLVFPLSIIYNYKIATWVLKSSASSYMKSFYGLWTAFSLKNLFSDPLREHSKLSELTPKFVNKLRDIAAVFETVLQLADLDSQMPERLRFDIQNQDRELMEQFISEVKTLDDDRTILFQKDLAQALSSFRLFMDIRKPFSRLLAKIGQLDLYASAAHQILLTPTKLSFATFVEKQGSFLRARDLWNPLLSSNSAISNDVLIDGTILITGPNASGKSTLMRAVAINIYLAQTLGIAAASSMEFSTFTIFNSFMKHEDSVGEESSYQSEVRNMRNMIAIYEKMESSDRAFMILDEPFRSTNPAEAEQASRTVIEEFIKHRRNLMMVATHLRNLTDIGFQMHLENFRLTEGIGHESSALSLLREKLAHVIDD